MLAGAIIPFFVACARRCMLRTHMDPGSDTVCPVLVRVWTCGCVPVGPDLSRYRNPGPNVDRTLHHYTQKQNLHETDVVMSPTCTLIASIDWLGFSQSGLSLTRALATALSSRNVRAIPFWITVSKHAP